VDAGRSGVRSIAWLGLGLSLKDKTLRVIEKCIHSQKLSLDPVACISRLESPGYELSVVHVANIYVFVVKETTGDLLNESMHLADDVLRAPFCMQLLHEFGCRYWGLRQALIHSVGHLALLRNRAHEA
jgi:hypothetical protein